MNKLPVNKLEEHKVGIVYLFGSTVYNIESTLSDVDIGVVFTDITILKDSLSLYNKIGDIFYEVLKPEKEIDLVFLQETALTLQYNVICEGKIIYEVSPEFRANYEEKVINEYLDFRRVNDYFNKIAMESLR